MDKLKVMLSFMRELNDGNIATADDYGLTTQEFCDIVEACQDAGYIKGAMFLHGGMPGETIEHYFDAAKLTVAGMEYLHEHTKAMRAYKGLKEIREWLPW